MLVWQGPRGRPGTVARLTLGPCLLIERLPPVRRARPASELRLGAWLALTVRPHLAPLTQVVQGLLRASPKDTTEPPHLAALWLHESSRVFGDRLTCAEDRGWLARRQGELLKEVVGDAGCRDLAGGGDPATARLIYGDYLVPGADPKVRAGWLRLYLGPRQGRRAFVFCAGGWWRGVHNACAAHAPGLKL